MLATVDRSSPVPLYYQLKQILVEKIDKQEWQPGDLIPSEQELQDVYGLSRTTVRQTLSEMVNEGRLLRQRGRGTFVASPKFTHDPARRLGLSEFMRQQGLEPGWHVLATEWVVPPEEVQEALKLKEGEQVYRIHRLRLANNDPIGHHVAFVPPSISQRIDLDALTEGESLRYLHAVSEMADSVAHRTIEAIPAEADEVELLGVAAGSPILLIERLITTANGTPIEFLWAFYRGDRFKYQITM